MTEYARLMPTGAWVTVNDPQPGDCIIQRWDPNAPAYGHIEIINSRWDALRYRVRRIWKKVTRR